MQTELSQQTPWVTIAIFGMTGLIVGALAGGILPAVIGMCFGIMLGGFSGPHGVRLGYAAAVIAFTYACGSFYTVASLPGIEAARAETLTHTLPTGASFNRVYRFLKQSHANRIAMMTVANGSVPGASTSSVLVADYDSRFLLHNVHYRTKFIFDKHLRLYRCWVSGIE